MKRNNRRRIRLLAAVFFLGCSLLFQPASGRTETDDFIVFYSGNVFGEMEACGG